MSILCYSFAQLVAHLVTAINVQNCMHKRTLGVVLLLISLFVANAPDSLLTYTAIERVYAKTDDDCGGDDELVWFARILYSEDQKSSSEYENIAWTVRERVDTEYTGTSYEEVATAPYQYSGLVPDLTHENNQNLKLTLDISQLPGNENRKNWETAIATAKKVCNAPTSDNPFPPKTRHFYNRSIKTPFWAKDADGCRKQGPTLTVCWGVK